VERLGGNIFFMSLFCGLDRGVCVFMRSTEPDNAHNGLGLMRKWIIDSTP